MFRAIRVDHTNCLQVVIKKIIIITTKTGSEGGEDQTWYALGNHENENHVRSHKSNIR